MTTTTQDHDDGRAAKVGDGMTSMEREILEEIGGLRTPRSWGAAVSACLEGLRGSGYLDRSNNLTGKGQAALTPAIGEDERKTAFDPTMPFCENCGTEGWGSDHAIDCPNNPVPGHGTGSIATPPIAPEASGESEGRIKGQCAHFGGIPGGCLINDRNWAPGVVPTRCALCPNAYILSVIEVTEDDDEESDAEFLKRIQQRAVDRWNAAQSDQLSDEEYERLMVCAKRGLGRRPSPPVEVTDAARDVLAERQRQVSVEGWSPEHDDKHDMSELSSAAACYAMVHPRGGPWRSEFVRERLWPWDRAWWKPTRQRQNLVKAGALILAEIERLDRAALAPEGK